MIGKIIADFSGLTEKLGSQKNGEFDEIKQIKTNIGVNKTEWKKFQQEVKAANGDTVKIKTAIDNSGLKDLNKIDGLYNYAVNQSKAGKEVDIDSVNNLITNQNIANQAHGIPGVKKAIKAYNDSLTKYKDGTTEASEGTKNLCSAISNGNSSLGNYLSGLDGAKAGLGGYAGSLATATLKTFALEAATTAMNAAISFGISFVIEGIVNGISYLVTYEERAAEAAENFTNSIKESQSSFAEGSKKIGELSAKYSELSKGVSDMGNNISLTDEQYTEYKNTVSELSDLMPNLSTLFNDQGEKIGFVGGKLADANKEYKKYRQNQAQNLLRNGDENGNKFQSTLDDFKNSTEKGKYGWNDLWRDYIDEVIVNALPFGALISNARTEASIGGLKNTKFGRHLNFDIGTQIFGAEEVYSTTDQIEMLEKLVNTSKDEWANILHDSAFGDSKEANLVEELLGINVDKVAGMDVDSYNQLQESLAQKISGLQQELGVKAGNITSGMIEMLHADDDYWTMQNEDSKNAITTMISGLNYDALTGLGIDLNNQNDIETWVSGIIDDVNANKGGLSDAIQSLFKLDTEPLSPTEAKDLADQYVTTIAKAMYGESVTNEQTKALKKSFGFEEVDTKYNDFHNVLKSFNETKTKTVQYWDSDGKVQYKKVYDTSRAQELNKWADENNVTQEELENLKSEGYGAKTSIEELTTALDTLRNTMSKEENSKSFTEVWDSIGTTGTDEENKALQEEKQRLKELAEAGKLTKEELSNSPLADEFEKTGISIDQATQKINGLVESAKQLDAMKTGISAITSAYSEKNDSEEHTVSTSTLGSMYDTLGIEEWDEENKKVWENYKKYATDGKKSMADTKKAQDELAKAYINSNNFLANLNETNKGDYKTLLKQMGVTNANEVVTHSLRENTVQSYNAQDAKKKDKKSLDTLGKELENATEKEKEYYFAELFSNKTNLETNENPFIHPYTAQDE